MQIDIISPTIKSTNLFNDYINKRRPVKFNDVINDNEWKGSKKWTDLNYLNEKAGDDIVKVEVRESNNNKYGEGNEITIKFSELINLVNSKNSNYYLTTQELIYSIDDQPSILSSPLIHLQEDFPFIPKIMGNLIPQNINLWMGYSKDLSTSGLHHDYHDNLYILLSGEKHFTLYDPNEYSNMYLIGNVIKLHSNGRINYEDQITLADGSHESSNKAVLINEQLDILTKKLIKAEENGIITTDIENEIDQTLEDALDAEIDANDYIDSNDEDDNVDDNDDDEEDDNEEDNDIASYVIESKNKKQKIEKIKSKRPNNFSQVDTSLSLSDLLTQFPRYVDAYNRRYEVTLKAGEMLYLPAGWFHEVKSKNSKDEIHMAVNYWFHPPDNISYDKPYSSDFWKNDWIKRGY